MAASVGSSFFKGETGRNTRGLLRLIILVLIAATAVASRLFSVIRFESIIHECMSILSKPRSLVWQLVPRCSCWTSYLYSMYNH
jgi:hypothetical protein